MVLAIIQHANIFFKSVSAAYTLLQNSIYCVAVRQFLTRITFNPKMHNRQYSEYGTLYSTGSNIDVIVHDVSIDPSF